MNCIIDRGNSKTKIYFFQDDQCVDSFSFFNEEQEDILSTLRKHSFEKGILSSSANIPKSLEKATKNFVVMSTSLSLPIRIDYKTPHTLGTDRIALAVGAQMLFPNKNCLIISAGSCITLDIIDNNKQYQGGIISPGIAMRAQAMHTFTDKLPLIQIKDIPKKIPLVGKTTQESIESGVYNSIFAEINGLIEQFQSNYQDLTVIITGGDMKIFELNIKNKIFAEQNLQAKGLNRILNYNA